jgi:multidrug efflux pump subunit AcrB
MDEVGGALIAIALVLSAVFIPAAFIPGISGQFFRQFAVTIASATIISCLCSLTLSPALCALLFKPHQEHAARGSLLTRPIAAFFRGFNYTFDKVSLGYGEVTRRLLRVAVLALVVYAGLIGLTGWQFARAPTGFIPNQDQGYLITVVQLPPGASLARTDAVCAASLKSSAARRGSRMSCLSPGSMARPSPMRQMPARFSRPSRPFRSARLGASAQIGSSPTCAAGLPRSRMPSSSPFHRRRCAASGPRAASR